MDHHPALADDMRAAAQNLLRSLRSDQLPAATAAFEVEDRFFWTYIPGARPGIGLFDLDDHQRSLAMALLDTGLSAEAASTARSIMELEDILLVLEKDEGIAGWERRHPHYYWVRVMGDPSGPGPWAWSFGGHHVSVHLTLLGDQIACTPQFLGANPARVPRGSHEGLRTLPATEDLARELVSALSPDQLTTAVVAEVAPHDLATRSDPVADLSLVPVGLPAGALDSRQRDKLSALITHYFDRARPEIAQAAWQDLDSHGLDSVTFAWSGPLEPGHGHYYAVRHDTFLLEYDNVQNDANHIHSVWRDLRHDWGHDVLAAHRAAHH